ncbi:protein of unknown function [Tenacibaculum sp. 190524A02b]|uniref:Uncharacterized protein n=1 Tax=Tenacibaculum vairaonense TaxID=3137860 RepID=A0ABP1FDC1_9FLAO
MPYRSVANQSGQTVNVLFHDEVPPRQGLRPVPLRNGGTLTWSTNYITYDGLEVSRDSGDGVYTID